jgi:hypothetical protein
MALTCTPQYASTPGFYQDYQYDRATTFLGWLRGQIAGSSQFRNVGMIEVVNEPVQGQNSQTQAMRSSYYPAAYSVSIPVLPSPSPTVPLTPVR